MTVSETVTRVDDSSARLWRQPWPDIEGADGGKIPAIYYHQALGIVAARYNSLEIYFQSCVGMVLGLRGMRIPATLTHIGAVTLIEILRSVATDVVQSKAIKDELEFCCKLFDVNRINRNFMIHSATEANDLFANPIGVLLTKRSARGKVKADHYALTVNSARQVADEIFEAIAFLSAAIGPISNHKGGKPLRLPNRPVLPKSLGEMLPKRDIMDFF
ncbi:MAG: hypothetical protein ACT4OK_13020 [Gemmobacter sp.]